MEKRNLTDLILEELKNGPKKTITLIGSLQRVRPGTTKQAVYASLRSLKQEEKITVHGKHVSLSRIWVAQMAKFFSGASRAIASSAITDEGFLNLEPGDRVAYTFKNPVTADVFWAHAFDVLADITPKHEPIYIWNPHEWFFLAHRESERAIFDRVIASGKQIFLTCGNRDPLDHYVAREFDGTAAQYYLSPTKIFPRPNYYVNVFGSYVLEVTIDEKTAGELDDFYKSEKIWNAAAEARIKKLMNAHGRTRLTISHNPRRAEKFKKMLGRAFVKISI